MSIALKVERFTCILIDVVVSLWFNMQLERLRIKVVFIPFVDISVIGTVLGCSD